MASINVEVLNDEELFTEELVKSWFCEILCKIINVHLVGLFLLSFFLYDLTLGFLVIYLMIYDAGNILLLFKHYKKETRFFLIFYRNQNNI